MRSTFFSLASLAGCLALIACGGASAGVDDPTGAPSPDDGDPSTPAAPGDDGTTKPGEEADPGGPRVTITMRGSTAPFAHADGFAGETPKNEVVAVKSLWLLRTPTDPSPVRVFDHGAASIEAELVSGTPTEVGKVAARSLPSGVFTMAKAGVAYVRYAVGARMHTGAAIVDGEYDNVQVLSDGAIIDGKPQNKGHFRYAFVKGGSTLGALEGEDAPTPVATSTGGIAMDLSGPETFYVFPVQLAIDPTIGHDVAVEFTVNVTESFRWQDQALPAYSAGVFDTTPATFEPVMAFGANSFELSISP